MTSRPARPSPRGRYPRDPFDFERLEPRAMLTVPGVQLGIFHTYAQLVDDMRDFASYAPSITRLIKIGTSVQNRDIYALKITDNPDQQEAEPEFYYQGLMHGDETVGQETSMYFIDNLLSNYGTDARLTGLVNNTEIWVVPTINPDGTALVRRGNANNVDLNRSYPDFYTNGNFGDRLYGPAAAISGKPLEVQAVMNWTLQQSFTLAANFHTGAVVVNYPYDGNNNGLDDYDASPDDGLYRSLAVEYSRTNGPMYSSNSGNAMYNSGFPQGITNGDDWYEIAGGQQDWSYRYAGIDEVTIELSNTKWPAASTLPTFWNYNRDSMTNYLAASQWGISGIVKDANTGLPLAARVKLVGNTQPVFTDPDVGDFHRITLPGSYSLLVEAPGYASRTISGITVVGTTNTSVGTVRLARVESVAPTVTSTTFARETLPQTLRVQFSEYVGDSVAPSDFTLANLTTGATVPASAFSLAYDDVANAATLTFTAPLDDGRYRLGLAAGSVSDLAGNNIAAYQSEFTFSRGDATGDGLVNFDDLLLVAQNYGATGRTFGQGNFDYDPAGNVGFDDLLLLSQNYGESFLTGAASPASPLKRSRRVATSTLVQL